MYMANTSQRYTPSLLHLHLQPLECEVRVIELQIVETMAMLNRHMCDNVFIRQDVDRNDLSERINSEMIA